MERAFVSGLSEQSRYFRFFYQLHELTPAMVARFTQVDYDREMALVAIEEKDGVEKEVAVCRYVTLPDDATCEYAIVVADEWQGRGLGRRMMERLIGIARAGGLRTMEGWVLAGNRGMLEMCARLGFVETAVTDDPGTRKVTLDLS